MLVPPFFPDQAKPYISETESKALFDRINEIFRKTGFPLLPMMLIPFLLVIPVGFIAVVPKSNGQMQMFVAIAPIVLMIIFFILLSCLIALQGSRRKNGLKNLIEEWNRTEGIPKGIYFALGTENGVSPVDFFMNLTNRGYGNGRMRYVVIQNLK